MTELDLRPADQRGPVPHEGLAPRPEVDWDRHRGNKSPKILPPPGVTWRNPGTGRKVGHRYYTRVTTYADAITEAYNLTAWKLRRAVLGMGQRADYVRLAASYTDHDRDRDALDELVGKVLEAAGPNAADLGTALHSLAERLDRGEDLGTPPVEVLPDLAAYVALTDGTVRHVYREARVVCDELECAGTPDAISYVLAEPCPAGCGPDVLHIGDLKTGSIRYPGKMSTQLAIYAHSALYDAETAERTELPVCRSWGYITHLPVETGEAGLFWLDLEHGWRGAELCGPVRQWHKAKADDILRPFATVQPVKVVDGEVTRIETRLASTNLKAPPELVEVDLESGEITLDAEVVVHESGRVEVVGEPVERVAGGDDGRRDPGEVFGDERELAAEIELSTAEAEAAADPVREAFAESATRCLVVESDLDPAARRCELAAGHPGGHAFRDAPTPAEQRLDPTPSGVTTRARPDGSVEFRVPVERALEDDRAPDDAGPDLGVQHDLDAAAGADPIREAIVRCVTVRDLELLSSTAWRTWTPEHKQLAAEVHDRLEAAEAAERPRAAFEAAVRTASSLEALNRIMAEVHEAEVPWLDDELLELATARWRELR